ncbi:unnamed protein product [marine sediment metagenome]|uniref:Uncharacterized protein n=1 Tax=marine sediment metagenome TaxID=412755 RepID=X1BLV4_9ZZZZ
MDIRYKAYILAEAEAVHRQEMARMAQAVAAGMGGLKEFINNLELDRSRADIIKDNWDAIRRDASKKRKR